MNTTTTAAAPQSIAELIAAEFRPLWVGQSGEPVTGEAVARHVEAASELLARDGFARSYNAAFAQEAQTPPADSTMRAMLRWLIDFVREETGPRSAPRTVDLAMNAASDAGAGDSDTALVGRHLMSIVLTARCGNRSDVLAWAGRLGRTLPEVQQMLADTATAAREHGPAA